MSAAAVPNSCPLTPAEEFGGGGTGTDGQDGTDGQNNGLKYTYSTTTAAADPGSGFLRFNNATLASATALYISETDGDANAISALLATWDDSTSTIKGALTVRKDTDPSVLAVFNITGSITDNGTWDTFTVANVVTSGAFANNDVVRLTFVRAGDKGDTGSGSGWTEVVAASDQDKSSDTALATDNELFFTMTANKLYMWEAFIVYSSPVGGGTPDFKFDFSGPATLTGNYSALNFVTTTDALNTGPGQGALSTASSRGTATTPRLDYTRGWAYSTAGGSGSSGFQYRWAQNTSNANATRRHAGSVLRYRQLTP
jgi:hypothetical protein